MAAQHVCLLGDIDGIHRGPAGFFICDVHEEIEVLGAGI